MKKIFASLSILILIFVATGCIGEKVEDKKSSDAFCEVTDDGGRTITLAKKPERIVVTSTSLLEPLGEVGGKVVGRPTTKSTIPDFAKDAAEIGAVYQIDTEKLLACNPDLVLINKGMNEKLSAILDENKIPFAIVEMKTYDSVKKNVEMFSAITGQPDKGKKIVDDMDAKIKNVVEKIPKENKKAAILHGTAQGLSVQLDNSIAGNVLKILGWENVAAGMEATKDSGDTAPYSLETLIEQNPEIIFVTTMGNLEEIKNSLEKDFSENPAWQTIPAIKNQKIYYLPQNLFLLSPGINYPDAVEYMAKLIYPEVFE